MASSLSLSEILDSSGFQFSGQEALERKDSGGLELRQLALRGDVEGLKRMLHEDPTELHRNLFSRNQHQETPLGLALQKGDKKAISLLLSIGGAETIFVQGPYPESMICTLPCALHPPPSSHSSSKGAGRATRRSELVSAPQAELLYLLDESLERHINELARAMHQQKDKDDAELSVALSDPAKGSGTPPPSSSNTPAAPAAAAPAATATTSTSVPDSFQVGDHVRLRSGVLISSKATVTRNIQGKQVVKTNKAASKACLGVAIQRRVGLVMAVRADPNAPPATGKTAPEKIVKVVSIHSGHICEYSSKDLVYADGSLPGLKQFDGGSNTAVKTATNPVPKASKSASLKVGDSVRVKASVSNPTSGWGSVKAGDVGVIKSISYAAGTLLVDFPAQGSWQGTISEMEQVGAPAGTPAVTGSLVKPFNVGDRVALDPTYTGEGWNLCDGRVGVVTSTPYEAAGGEQRGIIVSSLHDSSECYCFRGTWLEHAKNDGTVRYKVGDFVQLDAAAAAQDPQLDSRCLGNPNLLRYGMVTHAGIIRDGVQRNIEVSVPGDEGADISMYPSFALLPASPCSIFTPQDKQSLVAAVKDLAIKCGLDLNIDVLVENFGQKIWSKLWILCAKKCGQDCIAEAFSRWQASRDQTLMNADFKQLLADVQKRLDSCDSSVPEDVPAQDMYPVSGANGQKGREGKGKLTWVCQSCKFCQNPENATICMVCQKKGKSWNCTECMTKNKVGARICLFCNVPRTAINPSPSAEVAQEAVEEAIEQEEDVPQPVSEDGSLLDVWHPIDITNVAADATAESLKELFSVHGKVLAVTLDNEQHTATICFERSLQARQACAAINGKLVGFEGKNVKADTKLPCLSQRSSLLTQYNCSACTFLNDLREMKCSACEAARPEWIGKALAELEGKAWIPGDFVVLSKDYALFGDVTSGPLKPGEVGTIVSYSTSLQTVKVKRGGKEFEYSKKALELVGDEDVEDLPVVKRLPGWEDRSKSVLKESATSIAVENQPSVAASAGDASDSDAEEEAEDCNALDDNAEIILNSSLREIVKGLTPAEGASSEQDPVPMTRMTSEFFYDLPHFDPIQTLKGLVEWKDNNGSTAAHHAAFMGLPRTLKALYDAGASRWAVNKGGQTPALLQDGLHDLSNSKRTLHCAITKGALFQNHSKKLMRAAVETPQDYCTSEDLQEVKQALMEKGGSNKALALARELLSTDVHARAYMAVAMMDEKFGVKATRLELERYISSLATVTGDTIVVDPIYYYAHYQMWISEGRPAAKKDRLRAAYALTAFRCFPEFCKEWVDEDDDLDSRIISEGLDADDDKAEFSDDEGSEDEDAETAAPDDPETEWQLAKEYHGMSSKSMDELMALTGLTSVKKSAVGVVKQVILQKRRPAGIKAETSMNFLFVGNPGCGKTTVARLLAGAMAELGFRKNPQAQETSAQAILKIAPCPVNGFVQMVKAAEGGTLFIDEAYRFSPNKGSGPPNASNGVLDYLLEAVENDKIRESTTFILAGYKDEIDNLLSYNIGFSSRFSCEFNFPDYTEIQLKRILLGMVKARGFRFERKRVCNVPIAKVLAQRIGRGAGKKGFGNARAVRNKVEEIVNNQTQRLGTQELYKKAVSAADYRILTCADTVGSRPDFTQSALLRELDSMVGLTKVKASFRKLVELQVQNYDREMAGDKPEWISLHRVFYGNPGTGKTTVARLYGALLKDLGLLSKGDFLECTPADLTGDAEGGAAANTKAMLERARGKVLFIDEAYVLDPNRKANQYGGNVLDTLVEKLEGEAGSDIAVILAGYKQEMFDMLENNPGLRRRFNIDDFGMHFEDLSDAELRQVLIRMVGKAGLAVDNMDVVDGVVALISQKRRTPNFGNAGAVGSLLNVAKVNKSTRLADAARQQREAMLRGVHPPPPLPHRDILVLSDFVTEELSAEKGKDAFANLYNTEHITEILSELESVIMAAKADGKNPADILADSHMVFVGPPGTGKTTVANKFGVLFKNLGLLPSDNVIVVTGTSLQGQYVGETKNKVVKVMQQARGGILFIDEAYGLDPGGAGWGYAAEAVDTLIGEITSEEFKGNLLVIMAGYSDRMDRLFERANPGLRSRFDKQRIEFRAWTGEQAATAALGEIERDGKSITEEGKAQLLRAFADLASLPGWASARDVFETVLPAMYSKRANRMMVHSRLAAAEAESQKQPSAAVGRKAAAAAAAAAMADFAYDVPDVVGAFEQPLRSRSGGAGVMKLGTMDEYQTFLSAAKRRDQLAVICFSAEWCGPCKQFAPTFAGFKGEFAGVTFAKVDVDANAEVAKKFGVTSVPCIIFFRGGREISKVLGGNEGRVRENIIAFSAQKPNAPSEPLEVDGIDDQLPATADGIVKGSSGRWGHSEGPTNNGLGKNDAAASNRSNGGDSARRDAGPDAGGGSRGGGGGGRSSVKKKTAVRHKYKRDGDGDEEEGAGLAPGAVQAALEAACKAMGYTLDQIAAMLGPGGKYDPALLQRVMADVGCSDEGAVTAALDVQRPEFLGRVKTLIKERERAKTAEEALVQSKIKAIGRCPMDFEWLRVDGGWRCAGGSHFMTDAEINCCNSN